MTYSITEEDRMDMAAAFHSVHEFINRRHPHLITRMCVMDDVMWTEGNHCFMCGRFGRIVPQPFMVDQNRQEAVPE